MKVRLLQFLQIIIAFNVIYSQNDIKFEYDYAKFKYDNESIYFELYYSFTPASLTIKETENDKSISANLSVKLTDLNGSNIIDKTYNLYSQIDQDLNSLSTEDLVGVMGYKIAHGQFNLSLVVKDNYNNNNGKSFDTKINLEKFDQNTISISDIELSSKIIQDDVDPNSVYFKNSLEVIPNPKSIYGSSSPILYYYFEIYNDNSEFLNNNMMLERIITKNNRILDKQDENLTISKSDLVKAGFVNISSHISGKYNLVVNIKDSENNIVASQSKDFFVYNPNIKVAKKSDAKLDYIKSEFGIFNEEECDYNFEISKYIAAESEKDLYESLNDIESKRKFLYQFWLKRDMDPETAINEFKEEYMGRLAYVNNNYGHRHKKGYKTDRGRVALIYGIPDRVDTRNNEAELKPYEVWNYDSMEGGVVFIFGDTMGISEMELLHSTKRGELYDSNWQRRLTIKGGY